jgi:hypothetical protein
VGEESCTILIQDMPALTETVEVDDPLGGDGAHVDAAVARPGDVARSDALAPVPPGALAWT